MPGGGHISVDAKKTTHKAILVQYESFAFYIHCKQKPWCCYVRRIPALPYLSQAICGVSMENYTVHGRHCFGCSSVAKPAHACAYGNCLFMQRVLSMLKRYEMIQSHGKNHFQVCNQAPKGVY